MRTQSELNDASAVFCVDDNLAGENISEDQSNIRRPTAFDTARNAEEETIIGHSLFTYEEALEPITVLKLATARVIDTQQAGKFLPARSANCFSRLFPHFFPYGLGHPGQSRSVQVSLQECVKYYMNLSNRQFAQDESFPLIAFDIISRKRAKSHISLTCRLNPKEIEKSQ